MGPALCGAAVPMFACVLRSELLAAATCARKARRGDAGCSPVVPSTHAMGGWLAAAGEHPADDRSIGPAWGDAAAPMLARVLCWDFMRRRCVRSRHGGVTLAERPVVPSTRVWGWVASGCGQALAGDLRDDQPRRWSDAGAEARVLQLRFQWSTGALAAMAWSVCMRGAMPCAGSRRIGEASLIILGGVTLRVPHGCDSRCALRVGAMEQRDACVGCARRRWRLTGWYA